MIYRGDGKYIYLANTARGIETYSVNTTGYLTHINNANPPGAILDVWGDGNFIYLANNNIGIYTYSVNTTGYLTHIDNDYPGGAAANIVGRTETTFT